MSVALLPYYGGKSKLAPRILPQLPVAEVTTYVEPFAGGASILLNRPTAKEEVLNDIDGELTNLFRVVRDNPDELQRLVEMTPYSVEEYRLALARPTAEVPSLERARRYYFRLATSWGARAQNPTGPGQFMTASRKAEVFRGRLARLPDIAARLKHVVIENRDAMDVIERYDSPTTLFYLDPPYDPASRHTGRRTDLAYAFELSDSEYERLGEVVSRCQGFVAVSGYHSPLFDRLFAGLRVEEMAVTSTVSTESASRVEVLWTNYRKVRGRFVRDLSSPNPGGRPRKYWFDPAQVRELRLAGRSWRSILKELGLPNGALPAVRRAVQKGVSNHPAETPATVGLTQPIEATGSVR